MANLPNAAFVFVLTRVEARLIELRRKLEAEKAENNPTDALAAMYRLQGNIGALEWVLREMEEANRG